MSLNKSTNMRTASQTLLVLDKLTSSTFRDHHDLDIYCMHSTHTLGSEYQGTSTYKEVCLNIGQLEGLPKEEAMTSRLFPVQWHELSPEEKEKVKKHYPGPGVTKAPDFDFVRFDNGILMPRLFLPFADRLYNFEVREDDIWIVSFPKSGTTWTMEMVWMLVNNVDKEKAAEPATLRIPFTEMTAMLGPDPERLPFAPEMREVMLDPISYAGKMPKSTPRVLKTHLPLDCIPHGIRANYHIKDMTYFTFTRCP